MPDVSAFTTGAARANLRDGHFMIPPPTPGPLPEIDASTALAIATAWTVDFGLLEAGHLTEERGAPVDPTRLRVCRKPLYAKSSYLPPPADLFAIPLPRAIIRGFGPWWLVPLCDHNGTLTVVLAVSAYDTDLTLAGGHLMLPPSGGNWFLAEGVPLHAPRIPLSPEDAVLDAAHATNRLIASVPELIATAEFVGSPQMAQWRFTLASPAAVTRPGSTTAMEVSDLYVVRNLFAPSVNIRIPALNQPARDSSFYDIADTIGGPVHHDPVYRTIYFTPAPDAAIRFDDVIQVPISAQ